MNKKVMAFYETMSADEGLRNELVAVIEGIDLNGLGEEGTRLAIAEAAATFAAEHDLDLSAADILVSDTEAQTEGELSETELEAVVGGECGCAIVGAVKGCGCFIVGANQSDAERKGYVKVTVCVFGIGASGTEKELEGPFYLP